MLVVIALLRYLDVQETYEDSFTWAVIAILGILAGCLSIYLLTVSAMNTAELIIKYAKKIGGCCNSKVKPNSRDLTALEDDLSPVLKGKKGFSPLGPNQGSKHRFEYSRPTPIIGAKKLTLGSTMTGSPVTALQK